MENLWARRTNSNKLTLSTSSNGSSSTGTLNGEILGRGSSIFPKRFGADTPKRAGFGALSGGPAALSSAASTAFDLGSGAFASFGSARTPKTPGVNPLDSPLGAKTPTAERPVADDTNSTLQKSASKAPSMASISETSPTPDLAPPSHTLREPWSFWFRPPLPKGTGYDDYEKTLHGIATVRTVEEFFTVYRHLKRPSTLPPVSDYHLFKEGIRPIWEDDVNRRGGKWVVRMKKGVADRYWEELLLALVGDQFGDESQDVCGAVLSIRNGEDTLSIWTRVDGRRVLKIRETMKQVLDFPANTKIDFKSHDSSIQQRAAVEESRREKGASHNHNQGDKRQSKPTDEQRNETGLAP